MVNQAQSDSDLDYRSDLHLAVLSMHTSPLAPLGGRETGGMNVYILETTKRLTELGVMVDIFIRRDDLSSPEVEFINERARVIRISAGPGSRVEKESMSVFTSDFARGINTWADTNQKMYDVIHSHYWLSAVAGVELARNWRIPHVAMFHTLGKIKLLHGISSGESPDRLEKEKEVVGDLDKIVIASDHERQLLREIYAVPAEKVITIPPGVDLERFTPGEVCVARDNLNLSRSSLIFLAGGRMEPLKALDNLINALAGVPPTTDYQLLLFGGNEHPASIAERKRLVSVAKAANVGSKIKFLGPLDHDILPEYYRAADLVVVPSLYESFGMVALEAMASGRPVIASKVGGLAGMFTSDSVKLAEQAGILVPPDDVEQLSYAILTLIEDADRMRGMGNAARIQALRFSWSGRSQLLNELYREMSKT